MRNEEIYIALSDVSQFTVLTWDEIDLASRQEHDITAIDLCIEQNERFVVLATCNSYYFIETLKKVKREINEHQNEHIN